jgi:hypothetical protein
MVVTTAWKAVKHIVSGVRHVYHKAKRWAGNW